MHYNDEHFRFFAGSLERAIEKYGGLDEITVVERQKEQIETLVSLEKQFRKTLINHPWGPGCYKAFVHKIIYDERNILAARPYFRERQDVFTSKISKALKKERDKSLYQFHFNFRFVQFVLNLRKWPKGSQIVKLGQQIVDLRTEIIEMNMPLAISRARIFYSKTPKAHLSYMDFIQISCEGLMSAVDKFCLPYSKVFRSVAIGRMVGNFIEHYSETLVHFYPQDKRKIYRANKLVGKYGGIDEVQYDLLVNEINSDVVADNHKTDESEIASLMAAASCVSTDSAAPTDDETEGAGVLDHYPAEESQRPDNLCEAIDTQNALEAALVRLTTMERKLLRMKGIHLPETI
jgi:DNA-directed RNA polymerase specialized sigma subunit